MAFTPPVATPPRLNPIAWLAPSARPQRRLSSPANCTGVCRVSAVSVCVSLCVGVRAYSCSSRYVGVRLAPPPSLYVCPAGLAACLPVCLPACLLPACLPFPLSRCGLFGRAGRFHMPDVSTPCTPSSMPHRPPSSRFPTTTGLTLDKFTLVGSDTDYPGYDIGASTPLPTVQDCAALCTGTVGCVLFLYGSLPWCANCCWLNSRYTDPVAMHDWPGGVCPIRHRWEKTN